MVRYLEDGSPNPGSRPIIESLRMTSAVLPLIEKYMGTGRIKSVAQDEHMYMQRIDLGLYTGIVQFFMADTVTGRDSQNIGWNDFHHNPGRFPGKYTPSRGRGMIFTTGEKEFYVVGADFKLILVRKELTDGVVPSIAASETVLTRNINYLSVDEGHFDEAGNFITDRTRSGDENDFGVWMYADVGVVRVILAE